MYDRYITVLVFSRFILKFVKFIIINRHGHSVTQTLQSLRHASQECVLCVQCPCYWKFIYSVVCLYLAKNLSLWYMIIWYLVIFYLGYCNHCVLDGWRMVAKRSQFNTFMSLIFFSTKGTMYTYYKLIMDDISSRVTSPYCEGLRVNWHIVS